MPDNSGETVKVLQGRDQKRRVLVVRREDGCYVVRPERWYRNEIDGAVVAEGWTATERQSGLFAAPDLAEQEAMVMFEWLRR